LESLLNRFAIDLQSLWNHFGIALESLCNCFGFALNRSAIALRLLFNRVPIALWLLRVFALHCAAQLLFDRVHLPCINFAYRFALLFAIALQSFRDYFGQLSCNPFANALQSFSALRNRFEIALQSLCNRYGFALNRSAIALRLLCDSYAIALQLRCHCIPVTF
jgi:hypothetical protein